MKVLVANLGSTSFKYRLFDMSDEQVLARGAIDRIGSDSSHAMVEIGDRREERDLHVADHGVAVRTCLDQLTDPGTGCLQDASEVSAIGFKAVHGGRLSGVFRIDDDVLAAMEEMNEVAPAHNPPYVAAMRQLAAQLSDIPLVAAFETDFHRTIPERRRTYAIPHQWTDRLSIRRWGFHGASHRYIAERTAQLVGRADLRIISCHLGGSASLCAIRNGQSVATSMGMSPQTGLPHNNRVGDFDPFALPLIMQHTGMSLEETLATLANRSGLAGISDTSGDVRDLEEAAAAGNQRAQLAIDVFVTSTRDYLGAMIVELGGVDVIAMTGGIGENGVRIRAEVCAGLEELGIVLDPQRNGSARGECIISDDESRTEIRVIPTNEELIVARQAMQLLQRN
ncbi:MAG: acetate/propionate family kinase [Planctomycetales bacterium]|nr:acetate/propionate family kinase [Planctomycetales bacterium]